MPSNDLLAAQAHLLRTRERLGIKADSIPKDNDRSWLLSLQPPTPPQTERVMVVAPVVRVAEKGSDTVRHYPALGLAALKKDETAVLRVWLLFRSLDRAGRGWLDLAMVRQQVPEQLGLEWRQVRNLLNRGNGRYWTRKTGSFTWARGRVWLRGALAVATALDVEKLTGLPVMLPQDVLSNLGKFNASMLAAYHAGRREAARRILQGKGLYRRAGRAGYQASFRRRRRCRVCNKRRSAFSHRSGNNHRQ